MQPCSICKGQTEKRQMRTGEVSNYCPRCGQYTADSDGKEIERWKRFVALAWPIAVRLASESQSAGRVASHT